MQTFWDFLWIIFWGFALVAYLMVLFSIVGDLFRDHKLNGWWKALWIIFLIFLPFLTALVYLIARGRGMAERQNSAAISAQKAADDYIRSVSGSSASATDQIAQAKSLLDSGAITAEEFDALKKKALA